MSTDGGKAESSSTKVVLDGPSALEVVSQSLVEGVRGVLVAWSSRKHLRKQPTVPLLEDIKYKSVDM